MVGIKLRTPVARASAAATAKPGNRTMLDREACERRVYRLATLLTGDPNAAARVIRQVVDAQPDLRELDDAHMDRLTALCCRELRGRARRRGSARSIDAGTEAGAAIIALDRLRPQLREAWVLHHVYRMNEREIARATDCSVTATGRHLQQADQVMVTALGDAVAVAGDRVLAYALGLDVPELYRIRRARRERLRRWLLWGAIAAAVLSGLATVVWWSTRSAGGTGA